MRVLGAIAFLISRLFHSRLMILVIAALLAGWVVFCHSTYADPLWINWQARRHDLVCVRIIDGDIIFFSRPYAWDGVSRRLDISRGSELAPEIALIGSMLFRSELHRAGGGLIRTGFVYGRAYILDGDYVAYLLAAPLFARGALALIRLLSRRPRGRFPVLAVPRGTANTPPSANIP